MLYLGTILFVVVFILAAPTSRAYIIGLAGGAGAWVVAWAPFSYLLLLVLLAALGAAVHMVKTWPEREEPENPMAKYRREVPVDEE